MKTKVRTSPEPNIKELRAEVAALRSFVIGIAVARDPEGDYRPEFVEQILRDANAETIGYFESPEQFLELINKTED